MATPANVATTTSAKMMDFVARKTKKLQALRGNHDDPADAPMMAEEDFNFFRRVISAGDAPPPLPRRPFGPNVGEYEDNILQMVLYDGAAGHENTAHSPKVQREETAEDRKQRKKRERDAEREKAKMTDKEVEELEKLVDEVKEQTRDRSRSREDRNGKTKTKTKDASPEKPGRLYSLLHRDKKTTATANDSAVAEVDREAADLAKVLEDLDLSSANNRAFSFSKNSQNVVQDFSFILKDLINGVPTAYDDLRTLLDDKDNSLNRTYKQLPPFVQKLIAGVPKKVEAQAMGMVNETQKAMGAKPSESGAGIMNIAQSFLGVATLKQLVTNPAGVKGALMTIMNALKLRFPAFLGSSVLMSLGVFILLLSFWYCHKRGREVRLGKDRALIDIDGKVIAINDVPVDESTAAKARMLEAKVRARAEEDASTDLSYTSRSISTRSDESRDRHRRQRRKERERERERDRERDRDRDRDRTATNKKSYAKHEDDKAMVVRDKEDQRSRRSLSASETDSEYERERVRRRAERRERRARRRREEEEEDERREREGRRSGDASRSVRSDETRRERDKDKDRQQRRDDEEDREKRRAKREAERRAKGKEVVV